VATSTLDALGLSNTVLLEERVAGAARLRTAGRHVEIADVLVTRVDLGSRA